MKLTFRDLKKNTFTIDAEPSTTVGDVKKQVADNQSAEVPQIRLIHSGKVLQDDKTVESYSIKESDHIICMVQKPKAKPAADPTPSTPAPSAPVQTPAAPAPAAAVPSSEVPATPTPAGSAVPAAERRFDDTSPMMGPERQAAIANMESMGFERPQIERAMRAAFWNADRAVEFLLNGIPESLQQEANAQPRQAAGQPAPAAPAPQAATPAAPAAPAAQPAATQDSSEPVNLFEQAAAQSTRPGSGAGAGAGVGAGAQRGIGAQAGQGAGGNLDFLRENPMFQQLRALVQAQPSMLENVLQQVSAANPQLAQLISQNPEQFLQLLTEGEEGDTPLPPGAREISVSEEERDAIERLCGLGFERDLVIQAYFACDKNEELAANFLFDQPPEPEDDAGGA